MTSSSSSHSNNGGGGDGGSEDEDNDAEIARAREHRQIRQNLVTQKNQRRRAVQLQFDSDNDEEMKVMEGVIESKDRALKVLKRKLLGQVDQAKAEIQDLEEEFQTERESLLNTIREQGRDIALLEQLVECFLPPAELSKVWEQAVWEADKARWKLPKIRPRKEYVPLSLPGLGIGGGQGEVSEYGSIAGAEVADANEHIIVGGGAYATRDSARSGSGNSQGMYSGKNM
jgi:hypothetical protein